MTNVVYAIATMDSKGAELAFVADCLKATGLEVRTVDVGTLAPPTVSPDISREKVLNDCLLPSDNDRAAAISAMAQALATWLRKECESGRVAGVIGLGGSGGTALISPALRALPIGLPKVMVSTVASGNTAPYVDCSDITMVSSVVDVAGLNVVSRTVLANAAHALAGMVKQFRQIESNRPALGMTMFGVTTACVTRVREALECEGYDCLVFHATGTGGRAMEKLVDSGMIRGVLDITTTEVADEIAGGIFPAGSKRFETLLKHRIPLVLSVGAVDMVNFGAQETVPEKYQNRLLHVHNSQITLMRTTTEENRRVARWMAEKLNTATASFTILLPTGGVSALDAPGQPFYDPEADEALFTELEAAIEPQENRRIVRLPYHINAPEFADAIVFAYQEQVT
ncbi:MAG: Tm-1-like ATP-binding domain-containing protein [Planctomycetaceae bacterium]|nr:Tm-1-like ATP-binding domain-containing protein [Planctomycetaceae bacterium]